MKIIRLPKPEIISQRGKFTNPDSREKVVSRYHMIGHFNAFFTSKDTVNALTLPANNFIFENLLLKYNEVEGLNIITCEKNLETFKEGRLVGAEGMKRVYGDAFDTIKEGTHGAFNFIWLDLCSSLSIPLFKNLQNLIISDNIKLPCLLSITILRARESILINNLLEMGETLTEFRKEGFPKMMSDYAKEHGRCCELVELYNYKSHNKSMTTPMSIYTFTITPKI